MKARAWLSLLLIMVISFTGFSTTTDLNHNSDAITISDNDVGDVSVIAIVVEIADVNIIETKSYVFSQSLLVNPVAINEKFENVFLTVSKELLIPPLIQSRDIFNIDYLSDLNYKEARDCINYDYS